MSHQQWAMICDVFALFSTPAVSEKWRKTAGYNNAKHVTTLHRERKRQESNLPKTPARPPTGLKPARPTGSGTLPRGRIARIFGVVNRRSRAAFRDSGGRDDSRYLNGFWRRACCSVSGGLNAAEDYKRALKVRKNRYL